jgi:hypothetical protein
VLLLPPAELTPGDYQVDLEVRSGALMLPVALTLPVVQASWWHRVMGWLGR